MISVGGTNEISDSRSPLQVVAESLNAPLLKTIITIGASTAKHGVLLSHILCISRIMLAMGRRNDLTPVIKKFTILVTGLIILVLTIIGSFEFILGSAAFPLSFNVILTGFGLPAAGFAFRYLLHKKYTTLRCCRIYHI